MLSNKAYYRRQIDKQHFLFKGTENNILKSTTIWSYFKCVMYCLKILQSEYLFLSSFIFNATKFNTLHIVCLRYIDTRIYIVYM